MEYIGDGVPPSIVNGNHRERLDIALLGFHVLGDRMQWAKYSDDILINHVWPFAIKQLQLRPSRKAN